MKRIALALFILLYSFSVLAKPNIWLIKNKDGQRVAEIGNQSVTSLVKLHFPSIDQTMSLDIVARITSPGLTSYDYFIKLYQTTPTVYDVGKMSLIINDYRDNNIWKVNYESILWKYHYEQTSDSGFPFGGKYRAYSGIYFPITEDTLKKLIHQNIDEIKIVIDKKVYTAKIDKTKFKLLKKLYNTTRRDASKVSKNYKKYVDVSFFLSTPQKAFTRKKTARKYGFSLLPDGTFYYKPDRRGLFISFNPDSTSNRQFVTLADMDNISLYFNYEIARGQQPISYSDSYGRIFRLRRLRFYMDNNGNISKKDQAGLGLMDLELGMIMTQKNNQLLSTTFELRPAILHVYYTANHGAGGHYGNDATPMSYGSGYSLADFGREFIFDEQGYIRIDRESFYENFMRIVEDTIEPFIYEYLSPALQMPCLIESE